MKPVDVKSNFIGLREVSVHGSRLLIETRRNKLYSSCKKYTQLILSSSPKTIIVNIRK